jgi:hypothetical protein
MKTLTLVIFLGLGFAHSAFALEDKLPNSAFAFGSSRNEAKLHSYFGIAPGIGQASGTQYPQNSGFVYGATFGVEVQKAFGLALTYQRDSFSDTGTGLKSSVHQILLETNVFSLLVLNGGFQVGDIVKTEAGYKSADFGFGLHVGLDVSISAHVTAGITGYCTFVMEQDDHHTIINLMLPLKYWF